MYFPANFVKFSRMSFLQNTSGRLLLHVLYEKVIFYQVILSEIRRGLFFLEFRCTGARKKFRTRALLRIFNYSREHLNLPGHCKIQNTPVSQAKKHIFNSTLNFASEPLLAREPLFRNCSQLRLHYPEHLKLPG